MTKNKYWLYISCLAALFAILIISCSNLSPTLLQRLALLLTDDSIIQTEADWKKASPNRGILGLDDSLQLLWEREEIYLLNNSKDASFVANEKQILFIGSLDNKSYPQIISLSANDAALQYKFPQAGSSGRSISLANSYFCTGHIGSGRIACYQAENGQILWTKRIAGTQHISYLKQIDTTLFATTIPAKTYSIDVLSGEILAEGAMSGPDIVFWRQGDVSFSRAGLATLVSRKGEEVLWEVDIDQGLFVLPVESKNSIFVKSGRSTTGDVIGTVTAINKADGAILWRYENVVSSVGVSQGYVSFLTLDAELITVEESTGVVVGSTQFAPRFEIVDDAYIANANFAVVSIETKIFAYFGDSRQLFAFEFTPPETGESMTTTKSGGLN